MQQAGGVSKAFRAHFAQHNRQVVWLTVFTLITALLLWMVAYIFLYLITLLVVTALQGTDAQVPRSFFPAFAICGLLLCLLGVISRKIWPAYFLSDKKNPFEIFMDILLAVPRVTLAVWGNFSAYQSLSEYELEEAWYLLQAIARERRFNIQSLPLEIRNPKLRAKVVFALQLAGLVELHRDGDETWLALQGEKSRLLSKGAVRISTGK